MVYENVKALCEKRNLSICALEKKAGIGNGTIAGWRDGSEPTLKSLRAVAKVLDVKIAKLVG